MSTLVFGATGAAGAAGDSVLRACLDSPHVDEVRAIVRRPLAVTLEKLRVFIHRDFLDYDAVAEAFTGIDACLFCLGISVRQTSGEAEYRTITHDFAMAAARMLRRHSQDAVFHYIIGQGTALDSRMMWARESGDGARPDTGVRRGVLAAGVHRRGELGQRAAAVPGYSPRVPAAARGCGGCTWRARPSA